ncbi:MAG TPA: hydrogenase expression/formation protein HypE [Synergistaceae bacterium]|nr:hydrogenase expression/formation protein HypE [Synergistaceae bacterium]
MGTLTIGHGAGGSLTQELISLITGHFDPNPRADGEDCAILPGGIAVTIDGYTVSPLSFNGGDIGKLSVCGSANDLSVRGARPQYLALGVIAEEGLPIRELMTYMESAADVCRSLGIELVTGDSKVVPRGQVDGLFLSTCCIGRTTLKTPLGAANLRPGDSIILSCPPGMHGATIAAHRYGLKVRGLSSDCAALWPMIETLLPLPDLRCMRDCTRGGLGTVLCEWSEAAGLGIDIDEDTIPWDEATLSVCDILGFDPLHMAGEGCAAIAVSGEDPDRALGLLRAHSLGKRASLIGHVTEKHPGLVGIRTVSGGTRLVDRPVGELLPRIC